ncbi:MAG: prepilin-type N-terminal cleavage/methylation domain-containing protein [Candidatus Omnitrophica bacterium]|nr:prepilin-type N-terminal cleavage/methylation domain-containing protein [Candidatus Omnitrophota bacterium]MDD5436597.1 prepilin-type N-terminal cleavage/methylation domain-containing protein [Candidatus Omnitrophota bacterium]
MKRTKGLTLIELIVSITIGLLLILSVSLVFVWIIRAGIVIHDRLESDQSWIVANEHLKKKVHSSSYVTMPDSSTLKLYDYNSVWMGTYRATVDASNKPVLNFTMPPPDNSVTRFENVAASFDNLYPPPPTDSTTEVRIRYTAPFSGSLYLTCGVAFKDIWAKWINTVGVAATAQAYDPETGITPSGFIVACSKANWGNTNTCVFKITSHGDSIVWQYKYNLQDFDYVVSDVQVVYDKNTTGKRAIGYAIYGYGMTTSYSISPYLIITDLNGNIQVANRYGGGIGGVSQICLRQRFDSLGNRSGFLLLSLGSNGTYLCSNLLVLNGAGDTLTGSDGAVLRGLSILSSYKPGASYYPPGIFNPAITQITPTTCIMLAPYSGTAMLAVQVNTNTLARDYILRITSAPRCAIDGTFSFKLFKDDGGLLATAFNQARASYGHIKTISNDYGDHTIGGTPIIDRIVKTSDGNYVSIHCRSASDRYVFLKRSQWNGVLLAKTYISPYYNAYYDVLAINEILDYHKGYIIGTAAGANPEKFALARIDGDANCADLRNPQSIDISPVSVARSVTYINPSYTVYDPPSGLNYVSGSTSSTIDYTATLGD